MSDVYAQVEQRAQRSQGTAFDRLIEGAREQLCADRVPVEPQARFRHQQILVAAEHPRGSSRMGGPPDLRAVEPVAVRPYRGSLPNGSRRKFCVRWVRGDTRWCVSGSRIA
ncbi:MAG: hypothetical protein ACJ768_14945 [Gaiellaceae bacterium]